jgi:hypothetical protein
LSGFGKLAFELFVTRCLFLTRCVGFLGFLFRRVDFGLQLGRSPAFALGPFFEVGLGGIERRSNLAKLFLQILDTLLGLRPRFFLGGEFVAQVLAFLAQVVCIALHPLDELVLFGEGGVRFLGVSFGGGKFVSQICGKLVLPAGSVLDFVLCAFEFGRELEHTHFQVPFALFRLVADSMAGGEFPPQARGECVLPVAAFWTSVLARSSSAVSSRTRASRSCLPCFALLADSIATASSLASVSRASRNSAFSRSSVENHFRFFFERGFGSFRRALNGRQLLV